MVRSMRKSSTMLHLETLNELAGVDRRMEPEHRSLVEKRLLKEINELKEKLNCLLAVFWGCVISCVTLKIDKIYYQSNHLWKGQESCQEVGRIQQRKT